MKPRDLVFNRVFVEWFPRVHRYLACLTGDDALAEDIAQETFLRLHRKGLDGLKNEALRFWIFRVARNGALNEIDKRKRRHGLSRVLAGLRNPRGPDPESHLESRRRLARLSSLLEGLSADQRAVLLLREQEGLTYRQIAELLGVSENKVKIDIFRGRLSLRSRRRELEVLKEQADELPT